METSMCQLTVYKVYQEVIEDVINNVRDNFFEEGIDEEVLQELKQIWISKLLATNKNDGVESNHSKETKNQDIATYFTSVQHPQIILRRTVSNMPSINDVKTQITSMVDSSECQSQQQLQVKEITDTKSVNFLLQSDGSTNNSDDDNSDSKSFNESDYEENDHDMDRGGPEEEPLNSDDDLTDDNSSDAFDTENVIMCQYDKIVRSRNNWKLFFKVGVMNLNGDDYVFEKAIGEAKW